ncbi:hypothetical protein PHISCL_07808 [Aspergillus sclerotialis]|uniref:Lysine-specific metallo-endopeptidase domain-containing protein n=1 Tax=Aspergillus sclerotialis TaxID=2070753 RepID=A0A3A2Z9S6_9EURO|nr:hypothetical protein PHISCL_07808 [Aspergillus sclerotialis]
MRGAFDLADAGFGAFSEVGYSTQGGPRVQALSDLVSYLFADAMTDGRVDPMNTNFASAWDKFGKVQDYNTEGQGEPAQTPRSYIGLGSNELVIFCDFSHYIENEDCIGNKMKGYVCNKAIGAFFPMDKNYKHCKNPPLFGSTPEALTWEFASHKKPHEDDPKIASTMQLCPSYIKKVHEQRFQSLKDQGDRPSLSRTMEKVGKFLDDPLRTPIDVAYTFDATLLHEMTHAIPHEATVDSNEDKSYGWKNCRDLKNVGTKNAESYALFGLGARMISTQNQRPMADGRLEVLPDGPRKREFYDPLVAREADPEITLTLDRPAVTLKPSDAPKLSSVVPPGESSAVVYDVHTVFLPAHPSGDEGGAGSPGAGTTDKPPSTFKTSTRGSKSPGVASSDAHGQPSSGLPVPNSTPANNVSPASSSRPLIASTPLPGAPSSDAPPDSSPASDSPPAGSPSPSPASSDIPPAGPSSDPASSGIPPAGPSSPRPFSSDMPPADPSSGPASSDIPSPSSSSSRVTAVIITTSDGTPISTPVAAGSTPEAASITSVPGSSGVKTITSGSSTSQIPMTVVDVTKSDTTTPVTYISTQTSSDGGKPTGAWMCTGPLCDTSSGCKVPAFCDSPDLGTSWGLCCGFAPPALPDGTLPPPRGPPAPPSGGETDDGDDNKSESASQTQSSTSSSSSSASSSTPSSSSASSSSAQLMVTPVADNFLAFDTAVPSWYDVQQSILSEILADTTDEYITWTPSSSSSGSPVSPTSKPLIGSSSSTSSSSSSSSSSSTPLTTSSTEETSSSTTEGASSPFKPSITLPPSSPAPTTAPKPTSSMQLPSQTPGPTTDFVDNDPFGEVVYYTTQTTTYQHVYTLTLTNLAPAGDPTTLQTAMPSVTPLDNDGSSQCHLLDHDMCHDAYARFYNDAKASDNEFELLTGRTDKYSLDATTGLWDYQCVAILECDDDSPGMSGLQAYKA